MIGIVWPKVKGKYKGSASTEGYAMEDGTELSEKDKKWSGIKNTDSFHRTK